MDYYPIKKLLKDKKKLRLFNVVSDSNSAQNTPRKGNTKEEFLKQYLSQPGNQKRYDRDFTLSWANKQFEKNKSTTMHLSFDANAIHMSSSALTPGEHNKGYFPPILSPKMTRSSQFKSFDLRGIPSQHFTTGDVHSPHDFLLKRVTTESPRTLVAPTLHSHRSEKEKAPKNETETMPDMGSTMMTFNLNSKMWPSKGADSNKDPIIQGLEEIYYKDLKTKYEDKALKEEKFVSPYRKRMMKYKKKTEYELNRMPKKIADDKVLMSKFEDPYAEKIPFDKPINASFRNRKNAELGELETKIQILRNLKSLKEDLAKEQTFKSPKAKKVKLPDIIESVSCRELSDQPQTQPINLPVSPKLSGSTDFMQQYSPNSKLTHKRATSLAQAKK